LAFFTIDAGFLLSTLATIYPPTDQNIKRQIEQSLLQGMNRLEILESVNAIAGSGLKMLQYCYHKMRLASTSGSGVPILLDPVGIVAEGGEQQGLTAQESQEQRERLLNHLSKTITSRPLQSALMLFSSQLDP
jgi:hypothetical protein